MDWYVNVRVMAATAKRRKRQRGTIETAPERVAPSEGLYRCLIRASKKDHYLREIVPAGPNAVREADKVRTRLLAQVDQKRNARTSATVNQLLDRHFEYAKVDRLTLDGYRSLARIHIRPLIGDLNIGRIDGETLDSFYRELRRCRAHCRGRKYVEHRTDREHECDQRCGRIGAVRLCWRTDPITPARRGCVSPV